MNKLNELNLVLAKLEKYSIKYGIYLIDYEFLFKYSKKHSDN